MQIAYGWALLHAQDRGELAAELATRLSADESVMAQPEVVEFVSWTQFRLGQPAEAETLCVL